MSGGKRLAGGTGIVALTLVALACGGPREAARSGTRAGALPSQPSQPSQPSVLLVTLDTTRADHLGAYGSASGATPQLDALAARGVVFERAYAVAPMTLPAHASLFTGLLPTRTGVRWNGEQRLAPLPGGPATLAERFRAAGYATAAFVSAAVLDHAFGLDRGFELYDDAVGALPPPNAGPAANRFRAERPAQLTVERARAWLAAQPAERPLFLWVHLFEPHDPYLPPPPFAERFAGDPYSGEIAATDQAVAGLLESPRFRPEGQGIVSVIGDHGEGLGEHGEATHGILLHDAALHVPWIVAAPGFAPRRFGGAVSQTDLAPTLLALAGQPPFDAAPTAAGGDLAIDGVDLSPQMAGAAGDRSRTLYAESLYAHALYGWAPLASTRRGSYKWIAGARGELYDFIADPGEMHDLRASLPAEAGALERAVEQIRADETAIGEPPVPADGALAATLQSLGYLSGAASGRRAAASAASDDPRDRIRLHESLRAIDARWRDGDVRGAERALDDLFAAEPQNRLLREVVERQLRGAIAQLASGEPAAAGVLRVRLAQLVAMDGRRDEARELLEAAAGPTSDPATQALAQLSLASLALGERRHAEAERRARAALALEPRNAAAHNTLAVALDDLGRTDEAEEAYRAALALDPALYPSELNLARLLAGQPERRAEAAEHLRRFLARAPDDDPRIAEARAALARLSAGSATGG